MLAFRTLKFTHICHDNLASFDSNSLALDKGLGCFTAGRFDDAPECLARDIHPLRRFLVIQSFKVGQTQRFQFVQRQTDFIQSGQGNAGRLKNSAGRRSSDSAATKWSSHILSFTKKNI
jgi:hypothetical protein